MVVNNKTAAGQIGEGLTCVNEVIKSTGQGKVSSADTTIGYLEENLVAGDGITLTKQNTGANENIKVSLTPVTAYDGGNLEWM